MLTATATAVISAVMISSSASVTIPVSPTATPTYTAAEQVVYDRGWKDGVHRQYCSTLCRFFEKEYVDYKEEYEKPLSKDPEDRVGEADIRAEASRAADELLGKDRYGSKKSIADFRKRLKKEKCDCSSYHKKKKK